MSLTKWYRVASVAMVLGLAGVVSARAVMIAPQPIMLRVATTDGVVVGKVISIDDKTTSAAQFPTAPNKTEYKIAVVKVEKSFGNIKKVTEVRVGFIAPPPPPPNPGPGVIRPTIRPRRLPVQLTKDQEVCLFLSKHFEADFYVMPAYFSVITRTKDNKEAFDKDVAEVERCSRLLSDPMSGLEAKKTEDRLTTVAMLLTRYQFQAFPVANPRREPIPAAESKAILTTLAEADWTEQPPTGPRPIGIFGWQTQPRSLFFRLGLTPKDGWSPPEDQKKLPDAAKKWLRDNVDSYRIQRFVAASKPETKVDSKK